MFIGPYNGRFIGQLDKRFELHKQIKISELGKT